MSYDSYKPFINVEEMLIRLGGDVDVYKMLLKSFLDNQYVADLENALKENDYNKAKIAIHTLKGVAANLSLQELNRLCIDIEQKIKAGQTQPEDMPQLKTCMTSTLKAITGFCA